jgi:MoaA/NifB/PqqE/SkfB family radical SAM enzyme
VSTVERVAAERTVPLVVTVSLDGDEALNDEIRGIRGGYRRQVATFTALRRLPGVTAVLGLTLSRRNVREVPRIFDAVRADCPGLSIADLHVNVAQRSSHYYGTAPADEFVADRGDVLHALGWYGQARGRARTPLAAIEARYLRLLQRYVRTGETPLRCHALRSSCFVDPWGGVYPCITYDRPVGRLRDTGMDLAPISGTDNARSAGQPARPIRRCSATRSRPGGYGSRTRDRRRGGAERGADDCRRRLRVPSLRPNRHRR